MIKYRTELVGLLQSKGLPLVAAELGVAEGYNSHDLLQNGIEKLYMVDNWATIPGQQGDGGHDQPWHDKNYQEALTRVDPYSDRIVILQGKTVEMADLVPDNSLGLVYLDGDHSYFGVLKDLIAWAPKVVTGGIIAGHDFLNPAYGVMQAVVDFCRDKYEIYTIHENNPEDAGFIFIKTA